MNGASEDESATLLENLAMTSHERCSSGNPRKAEGKIDHQNVVERSLLKKYAFDSTNSALVTLNKDKSSLRLKTSLSNDRLNCLAENLVAMEI